MRVRLFKVRDRLRSSFWFLPSLMSLGAVGLAALTIYLEDLIIQWSGGAGWLFSGGAEGASAVLSTIAASTITITGVIFSVTLVALTLTSRQFGPRLLRNFTRDSVTHIVMGTFVATFLYCLLVLRNVRFGAEQGFVPHLSVSVAVLLALASVGVLIYFIHHISTLIQADEIVARVGTDFQRMVERYYPEREPGTASAGDQDSQSLSADFASQGCSFRARGDGYLQGVDLEALIQLAEKRDVVMRVEAEPGSYVTAGTALLTVAPGDRLDEQLRAKLREAFVLGNSRTGAQDVGYVTNQLVEIAVRALSPSLNDPFTAIRCIDRLGSGLCRVAARGLPRPGLCGRDGRLRVARPVVGFSRLAGEAFDQVRPHAVTHAPVAIRLLEVLEILSGHVHRGEDRAVLHEQTELIMREAREALTGQARENVLRHYRRVRRRVAQPAGDRN